MDESRPIFLQIAEQVENDIIDGSLPEDWLEARDPEYIRETLPALRAWSEHYFRAEVSGLEHIPDDGPALLVGNHSGGTLIADTFVLAQHFYDHFGPERRFHQLAHDLVFRLPGVRASLCRFGTVPASPANMRAALGKGAALLVYPGGDHETYRPTWEQDKIDFAGRKGFLQLSLELGTPIVPVVAIGGQETALFLGTNLGFGERTGARDALVLGQRPQHHARTGARGGGRRRTRRRRFCHGCLGDHGLRSRLRGSSRGIAASMTGPQNSGRCQTTARPSGWSR